jgi:hypothetical protein
MTQTSTVPLSAHELRTAVRQGHPMDERRLDRVLRIDPDAGFVETQAGTPWRTIAQTLRPDDEAAARVGAELPSVGTSVAWNAAGPDGRPAVAHVESLTVVTPDGELRRTSRTANPELFAITVGGQGLFGALYSVTLRLDSLALAVGEAAAPKVEDGARHEGAVRRLQLLLPESGVDDFLARARALCGAWRIPIVRTELRGTRQEGETFLSWARQSYTQISLTLGVPRTLGSAVRVAQLCGDILDAGIALGGSFSIAQTVDASREQVEACYPAMRAFLAEKRKHDPAERITNGWYRHHRSLFGRQACDSRWNR